MSIGILQCGDAPAELTAAHGTYGAMVERMLGADLGREAVTFDVTRGALPGNPSACRAYVLTGSPAGVYDDLPWIPGLLDFVRAARGRARLVGLCFGHQAMAEAFGGRVEKSAKGWGIGLHRYDVRHRAAWMDEVARVDVAASHQDQVVIAPPGARVVLESGFTPFAALDYGDAISFQCHPEFDAPFARALIASRRDRFGDLAEAAIGSYGAPHDGARVAGWIGRFLGGR